MPNRIPGYELTDGLGKGPMSRVFQAREIASGRIVAIKIFPLKMAEHDGFLDRFFRDARAAISISHRNLVQLIDVGQSPSGYLYAVMEYVHEFSVHEEMSPFPTGKGRHFTEAEALDVITEVVEALTFVHEHGLVHRDIKPQHIAIPAQGARGVARLADLGIANVFSDSYTAECIDEGCTGSAFYISPEQIRDDTHVDFRADIYSLGAVLYHVVTERPPFEGNSPREVMEKHLHSPLIPVNRIKPELSSATSEVINIAMAKRPADRYPSTARMLASLKAARWK